MGCYTCWLIYFIMVCLWCGRTGGHRWTRQNKNLWLHRLPNFLTHAVLLGAPGEHESSAIIMFLSDWHIIQSVARQFKFRPETLWIVGQRWRKINDKAPLIQLHRRNGHYFLSILFGRTCCWQKGNHWALYTGVIGLKSLLDMRNLKSKKCFNCPRKKLRSFCSFSSTTMKLCFSKCS